MTTPLTELEAESKEVANHLIYLLGVMEQPIPDWIEDASRSEHGDVDQLETMVMVLADFCFSLSAKERASIFNNRDNPKSRALLVWWVIYTASR